MKRFLKAVAWLFALPIIIIMGQALSANAMIASKHGEIQSFPVEDNVHIYKGAMVVVNTSGYALPGADTDGYRFVGIAYEECDNTVTGHSQGGLDVRVERTGRFLLPASSITQAMVGRRMYLVNDGAVDDTSTYKILVGTLVEYVSTTSGWVDIQPDNELTGLQDHLYLMTDKADKTVRLNNKTFTSTSGDITGARVAPRQGASTTGSVRGIECIPGGSASGSAFNMANLQGIISECYGNTSGNISGVVTAFEGKVDMPSGYAGTVTGPVTILRCFNDMHGTVTNGVFVIGVDTHGGNKAWDGLALLPDDDAIADDDESGTSGTRAGWIKVKVGSSTRYIRLYDAAG